VLETFRLFHFAQPLWLLGLLALPLLWLLPRSRLGAADADRLTHYADPHLLPHLIRATPGEHRTPRRLALWSVLWSLGVLAMAGPRWGYTEVSVAQPGDSVVVLLDISASMQATDIKPSRMARARQEIEDLLDRNPGLRVGLVAFASVARVVVPVTEDMDTVRYLLPSLSPDLLRWQGSRLTAALERAERLLAGQPPDTRHSLLLVSDGDFDEAGLVERVAALREAGVTLHVLGLGTAEGATVPAASGGGLVGPDGQAVRSRLDEVRLEALARAGGGVYRRADYRDEDSVELVKALLMTGRSEGTREEVRRVWDEKFYLPVLAMAVLVVLGVRRVRAGKLPVGRDAHAQQ
jgi:Ca-activated chloride channel family protein